MTSKQRGGDGGEKSPRPYTSIRMSIQNAHNLSELADRRNMSIDQLYTSLGFAETVRKLLVEENRRRLKDLESQKPE